MTGGNLSLKKCLMFYFLSFLWTPFAWHSRIDQNFSMILIRPKTSVLHFMLKTRYRNCRYATYNSWHINTFILIIQGENYVLWWQLSVCPCLSDCLYFCLCFYVISVLSKHVIFRAFVEYLVLFSIGKETKIIGPGRFFIFPNTPYFFYF